MLLCGRSGNNHLAVSSLIVVYFAYFVTITPTELVVNVKNHGGEVFQESIWANLSDDTVHLEVEQPDGSIIIQLLDFKNGIQILNAFLLGEEERNSAQFQVLCFVTDLDKGEFIPTDAMAKLRQKNPWAIRTPERDVEEERNMMDVLLDISTSDWISPHIPTTCIEAKESTYGVQAQLRQLVARKTNESSNNLRVADIQDLYIRSVKPFPIEDLNCVERFAGDRPCQCHLNICIRWYPCALKYCQVHDASGKSTSTYRCGIQTCRQCRQYVYSVSTKFFCLISSS